MPSVFFLPVFLIHLFEILNTQLYDLNGLQDLALVDNKWWGEPNGRVMSGFGQQTTGFKKFCEMIAVYICLVLYLDANQQAATPNILDQGRFYGFQFFL